MAPGRHSRTPVARFMRFWKEEFEVMLRLVFEILLFFSFTLVFILIIEMEKE